MKTIKLDFEGYWTGASEKMLDTSGVYCVYRGVDKGKSVQLKKVIYIGEAEDVKKRIKQHISDKDWIGCLEKGECFCYSNAYVETQDRERAEAALIYHYKPQFNDQHKYNYGDYEDTIIETSGKNKLIEGKFSVGQK